MSKQIDMKEMLKEKMKALKCIPSPFWRYFKSLQGMKCEAMNEFALMFANFMKTKTGLDINKELAVGTDIWMRGMINAYTKTNAKIQKTWDDIFLDFFNKNESEVDIFIKNNLKVI